MKTKNIILSLFLGAGLLVGCTEGFDALNTNPIDLPEDAYFFSKSDLSIAIRDGANYNYASSRGHEGGGDVQQRMIALGVFSFMQYGTGSATSSTYTPNDEWQAKAWNGFYGSHLWPINSVIDGTNVNEGYDNYKAIALIWRVYIQARITDYFGLAPFPRTEADNDPPYMQLDEQYNLFFSDLDLAMSTFDSSLETVTAEPLFGGDILSWKRFANSLRLRLALTISEVDENLCKEQIQKAINGDGGFLQEGKNAAIAPYEGWGNSYVYYMYIQQWGERNYLMTSSMEKMLVNIGGMVYNGNADNHPVNVDPRGSRFFEPSPINAENPISYWQGRKPGLNPVPGGLNQTISQMSKEYIVPNADRSAQLETYVETCFLMAEAAHRFGINGGKSAKEWYEEGVKASFREWGYDDATATAYLASTDKNGWGTSANFDDDAGAGNTKLEKIITQKYIGCYPDLCMQMWNDKRRLNLPAMDICDYRDTGAGTFPSDGNIQNPANFIQRTVYPQSEVSLNKAHYEAAVALLKDGDKVSSPVWWASKGSNYCTSTK